MVTKLLQPRGPSALELSKKQAVSRTALYKWLKIYNSVGNTAIHEAEKAKLYQQIGQLTVEH